MLPVLVQDPLPHVQRSSTPPAYKFQYFPPAKYILIIVIAFSSSVTCFFPNRLMKLLCFGSPSCRMMIMTKALADVVPFGTMSWHLGTLIFANALFGSFAFRQTRIAVCLPQEIMWGTSKFGTLEPQTRPKSHLQV